MINEETFLAIRRCVIPLLESIDRRLQTAGIPTTEESSALLALTAANAILSLSTRKPANKPDTWLLMQALIIDLQRRYSTHTPQNSVTTKDFVEDPLIKTVTVTGKLKGLQL